MNTPISRISSRSTILLAVCAFGAVCFAASMEAADAPAASTATAPTLPKNSIGIEVVKAEVKPKAAASSSSSSGRGMGSNSYSYGGSQNAAEMAARLNTSSEQDATYTITLKNRAKIAAKNLAVEYHFYNVKVDTQNGSTTRTVNDITSTENVDIAAGKSAEVSSQPIPHVTKTSVSTGPTPGASFGRTKGISTASNQSSSYTNVLGWHVEVRLGDTVISQKDEPYDLKAQLDQINKKN